MKFLAQEKDVVSRKNTEEEKKLWTISLRLFR